MRHLLIAIDCGDWCGSCQFLEFVGVPDQSERVPHCRLFAARLRNAVSSFGVLRLGECVRAENAANEAAS